LDFKEERLDETFKEHVAWNAEEDGGNSVF
jgi:hypothetical protein